MEKLVSIKAPVTEHYLVHRLVGLEANKYFRAHTEGRRPLLYSVVTGNRATTCVLIRSPYLAEAQTLTACPEPGQVFRFEICLHLVKRRYGPRGCQWSAPVSGQDEALALARARLTRAGFCVEDIGMTQRFDIPIRRPKGSFVLDSGLFQGTVVCGDGDDFNRARDAWMYGIGRSKAFGQGMLILDRKGES